MSGRSNTAANEPEYQYQHFILYFLLNDPSRKPVGSNEKAQELRCLEHSSTEYPPAGQRLFGAGSSEYIFYFVGALVNNPPGQWSPSLLRQLAFVGGEQHVSRGMMQILSHCLGEWPSSYMTAKADFEE
ncbi:hypothetical protein TrVFT333_002079 [Trichoderma virens FT-333]|nr:hypothetical protein TrVFT333_002079 [Trichoderma virens FT-333]